jgi:predicted DCC family thiol-disulfide oxidoreductase YuxK
MDKKNPISKSSDIRSAVEFSGMNIVFYDGVCLLCSNFIRLLLLLDRKRKLHYAPLQGEVASKVLNKSLVEDLDTVVFYSKNTISIKSDAVIEIFTILGFPFSIVFVAKIIPSWFRNIFYVGLAKIRYKVLPKSDRCFFVDNNDLFLE